MSEYEFTKEQEVIINKVALRCVIQCIALSLIGIVGIVEDFVIFNLDSSRSLAWMSITVAQSILFIPMGLGLIFPYLYYKKITTTVGTDISHLMKALKRMTFGFQIVVLCILGSVICDILFMI